MPRPLRLVRRLLAREGGFGLIELTIALSMLAIGIVSVTSLFVTGHLALRRASQSDTAGVLADKLLERFRAETWDTIGLSSTLVASTDSIYKGDSAYSSTTSVNDSTGLCSGSDPSTLPVACNPSRSIPDTYQSPPETAPDGRLYRIDTYVNWGCTDGSAPDMSTSPPTCTIGGAVQPFGQVKIVTVVIRDATSSTTLAAAPVYRVSSTFDRLKGGSMPTVTVTPTGTAATTTTTTTSPAGTPDPPTSVSLANGGGTGNAYVNASNATSLSVDVALPSTSKATDTITLVVSDGDPTHDQTATLAGTAGAGVVHFTGINGQVFNDGTLTFSANSSSTNGTSATTTSTAAKDTVAPDAPTTVTLQNGQGAGNAYINSSIKSSVSVAVGLDAYSASTDTVTVTIGDGSSTSSPATASGVSGGGTATVTGVDVSSLGDGTVTASATVKDAAGNTSTATTASFSKDTVGPTLTAISSENKSGGTAKTAEAGDKITLTFSEPILASSVAATSNVTISTSNGNGKPVTLTIPGLVASGGFTIGTSGSSGYLVQSGGSAAFNSSALSQPTTTQVRVTLASCSGSCSSLRAGGSVSVTVGPASALTDAAGNSAKSTTLSATTSFF